MVFLALNYQDQSPYHDLEGPACSRPTYFSRSFGIILLFSGWKRSTLSRLFSSLKSLLLVLLHLYISSQVSLPQTGLPNHPTRLPPRPIFIYLPIYIYMYIFNRTESLYFRTPTSIYKFLFICVHSLYH